jgi:hypothetical protein
VVKENKFATPVDRERMSGAYIVSFTASVRPDRATVLEFRMLEGDPEDPS